MDITFHKLQEQHLKEIYEIRFSVRENVVHSHQIQYLLRDQAIEDINQAGGWICKSGEEYVGYGFGIFIPEPLIGALFVKPEFHNQGIGSTILERVTQWFFEQGVAEISLTTDQGSKAEIFYQRRGWKSSGLDEFGQLILKKAKNIL
ncbi:GNAT family N-acetyltransferase [Winslowiella iniecta]|uniref:Acetyltransferase n=1 Tax=Winslowiella iniecta TaxID=1560201 RepID=A0A0L7T4A5_9GAMM|nr:GNAT family N-acetyltransferase [Winslowiella iniecta]KOC90173.1 acetyltransferase [Winslowiella iniecta]KOC94167.1 acetyltransferase [Winslowiella iniecta]